MNKSSHGHPNVGTLVRDTANLEREVSDCPRAADLEQLQSAYRMHRDECQTCTPHQPCEMARRLEEARRTAGVS